MTDLHVMLDSETWGTGPGCALRSIGAVTFNPFDWSHKRGEFYVNVHDERPRDPDTVAWWSKQAPEATAAFANPWPITAPQAVRGFRDWFLSTGAKFVWSHGATFDVSQMEYTMKSMWIKPPWDFRNVCDTRTLFRAACVSVTPRKPYTIKHHALHDAHNQAHAVELAFASLALHGW